MLGFNKPTPIIININPMKKMKLYYLLQASGGQYTINYHIETASLLFKKTYHQLFLPGHKQGKPMLYTSHKVLLPV